MSNAFDKASLVMLPHAYEEGKLYSLKPTDRSGDFTFSRGADTATRVNADGNIEKETQNLLLQSNTFDTTWTTGTATITGGQSDKDGGNDAWKLQATSTNGRIQQSISKSGVNTYSVYAKEGNASWIQLRAVGITASAFFNLDLGNVGNISSTIDANIEDVGNGWYRCSITASGAISDVRVYVASVNTTAVSVGDNVYIQDAQFEQGLVARNYIETTTAPVYGGLTDNMPRLDYTDATCPSLLLEPSRTNIIQSSEYFGVGINQNNCTTTLTTQTNPSGNNQSYLLSAIDSVNDFIRWPTGALTGSYFLSAFVKGNGEANTIRFRGLGGASVGNVYWDVAVDGTITFNGPSGINAITEDFGNGWYRIGFEETYDGTATSYFSIYPSAGNINASTHIWGVQWEAGSYPTSYIPTYGSTQTRVKDITDANHIIDNTNFTIFGEFNMSRPNASDSYGRNGTLILNYRKDGDGGFDYHFIIGKSSGRIIVSVKDNAGFNKRLFSNFYINEGVTYKYAVSYKIGVGITFFLDGQSFFVSDTDLPSLYLDLPMLWAYNGDPVEGDVKRLVIFPTALSDSECIALTTQA